MPQEQEGKLQYFPSPTEREAKGEVPSIVHDVLRSPVNRLIRQQRAFLECASASTLAKCGCIQMLKRQKAAYSKCAGIYRGTRCGIWRDQYAPTTRVGQRFLAHELTHTIQQQMHETSRLMIVGSLEHEREANIAADTIHAHKAIPTPKPLYLRSVLRQKLGPDQPVQIERSFELDLNSFSCR